MEIKLKNKKGQIITLIALALIMLFFVSYSVYTTFQEDKGVQKRVKTMDSFLFSMKKDIQRNLYVSEFRVVFLAQTEIANTGKYIGNFQEFFEEAVYNGTVSGEKKQIMQGAMIDNITSSLKQSASELNLKLNFSNIVISTGQKDPWKVYVEMNFTVNLTDKRGLASWYTNESIKSEVSIENFEDPLYLVETSGKLSRNINKTIYEGYYTSGSNVSNLTTHLEEGYYAAHSDAPSFIDRLEGNFTESNENGIESFVYIPDLSNQGISVKDKTVVDYIYFSTNNPDKSKVEGMPDWFKIDPAHETKYNVSTLTR